MKNVNNNSKTRPINRIRRTRGVLPPKRTTVTGSTSFEQLVATTVERAMRAYDEQAHFHPAVKVTFSAEALQLYRDLYGIQGESSFI